jgi:MSHA pilin protein MshC
MPGRPTVVALRGRRQGFTMIELVVVMVILGALAVVALPRLSAALGMRGEAYRDELLSTLRLAASTAQSHRRLVCAQFDTNGHLALRMARSNPASQCSDDWPGPDGTATWVSAPQGVTLSAVPSAVLYFQPAGTVSSTANGGAVDFSITPSGMSGIVVRGRNGLVE